MASAQERLAAYIKAHGPVPLVGFRPEKEKLWGLTFSGWTSCRYTIEVSDGTPTLTPQGPARYWISLVFAQRDAEEIAAKERRLIFCWSPGPLDEKACEAVVRKLKARSKE